jgi:site-specific recombinase XerD
MRQAGYPAATARLYQLSLERVAMWLSRRGRGICSMVAEDVPVILRQFFLRRWRCRTKSRHRAALHAWLQFRGLRRERPDEFRCAQWRPWFDEYDRFLTSNRGLSVNTRIYRRRYARLFLAASFGRGPAHWDRLTSRDVWRFSECFVAKVKPSSANIMLGSLKSLLRYAHLRGVCGPELVEAVPKVANYGWEQPPCTLTEQDRRRLIDLPPEDRPADMRDRAMLLCMLEAGLRASDVAQLVLQDFDPKKRALNVFSSKTGDRRWIPVPSPVADAIAKYIQTARATGISDRLFLRIHPPLSQPIAPSVVRCAVRRAYSRCGFPSEWTGTHRLRHTFATRLYARGATLPEISGLLGHRCPESSVRYTHTDLTSLRSLAQPWPMPTQGPMQR